MEWFFLIVALIIINDTLNNIREELRNLRKDIKGE